MDICLIHVPYTMGDERQGSSKGPERLVQAGANKLIATKGLAVTVERVDRGEPFRDSGNASLIVSKRLAQIVRQAIAAKQFPLVLAGGCDVSKGIISGFDHGQCCGVVWFDAHGDFNTPETTTSGYFDGMSLAVITGHCYQNYWAQIGNSTPIPESATLLLGVRWCMATGFLLRLSLQSTGLRSSLSRLKTFRRHLRRRTSIPYVKTPTPRWSLPSIRTMRESSLPFCSRIQQ